MHVQVGEEKFPSAVPFLPPLTDATMTQYFRFYTAAVAIIVMFGGLLSPILEVKLGLGGKIFSAPPPCLPDQEHTSQKRCQRAA